MEAGLIVQDNKPSAGLNTGTQQSMIMIEQQEDGGKVESDGDNFKLPSDTDITPPDHFDQIKAPIDNEISAAAVDLNNPS